MTEKGVEVDSVEVETCVSSLKTTVDLEGTRQS